MHTAQQIEQKHILLVDDEVTSRRVVEKMLRTSIPGVRVTGASDGAQALAVLDREPIDLLITDLAMPVIDGIELLLQVARRRLLVPLLVVTGHASPAAESRALSGGAIECFEKPIRREPFLQTIRALLFGGHRREPLDVVSLAGIVRLIGVESKTCTLHVSTASAQGLLAFSHGDLVDARQSGERGVRAAQTILGWKDPAITLDPAVRPGPWTIHVRIDDLLDQVRRRVALAERAASPTSQASLPELPPAFDAEAPEPALEFIEMSAGAEHPPASAPVVMPAPMPAPAAVRPAPAAVRPLPASTADREPAAPRLVAPPSLTARAASPRTGAPPPVPTPPRVAAPPRRSPGPSRPPRVAAAPTRDEPVASRQHTATAPLTSPPRDEPAAALQHTAAAPLASQLASPPRDESAASLQPTAASPPRDEPAASLQHTAASQLASPPCDEPPPRDEQAALQPSAESSPRDEPPRDQPTASPQNTAASPPRDEPAASPQDAAASPPRDQPAASPQDTAASPPRDQPTASTFMAPEDADCYQLQDLARELLRAAEFAAAEAVLRRALVIRPGDRVVEQNLRVLARRRALRSEGDHPRGA